MNAFKLTLGTVGLACCMQTMAQDRDWEGETRDAWLDGKLEAAYLFNTELNNFKIGTHVAAGHVTLDGYVPSESHRQLAEEIAKNLDGVSAVSNNLTIGEGDHDWDETERSFRTRFYDLTTTTRLKSAYAINDELSAMDISIDTLDGVVTLTGEVKSDASKQLAEEIALGYDHVENVNNRLQVIASR